MRIDGNIPGHVARAYGLKLIRPTGTAEQVHAPKPGEATGSAKSATPVKPTTPTMKITAAAPTPSTPSPKVDQLIAGKVARPVDFSAGTTPTANEHALSLYARSADRVEVATAVQVGRRLDVKA